MHAAPLQFFDKFRCRRIGEYFAVLTVWPVQNRAILRNDSVKDGMLGKNLLQFGELASGG
jgi:hypothetical protein